MRALSVLTVSIDSCGAKNLSVESRRLQSDQAGNTQATEERHKALQQPACHNKQDTRAGQS